MKKKKLLILDDDAQILEFFSDFFEGRDLELLLHSSAEAALRSAAAERPDAAVVDIALKGVTGLDVLRKMKEIDPALPVIIATGYNTSKNAIDAMQSGAFDYVTKPFMLAQLEKTVKAALEFSAGSHHEAREPAASDGLDAADAIIGVSPEMTEIWKMVGKIADSDATVLIQGESGTGKEVLARAIWANSRRRNKRFLAVNCAALPETLLESELFGHEKGAFTDAGNRRLGKLEACNGGTLFLDEIGEMSPANQGKLLRVLEDQSFERVGGNETVTTDVRIIAATNRSLIQSVREQKFRIDLFYRLRIIAFYLPPLRDRREDIPALAELFVIRYCDSKRMPRKRLAPGTVEMLTTHSWPGNIRELKNAVTSACLLAQGELLQPADFGGILATESEGIAPPSVADGDWEKFFTETFSARFASLLRGNSGSLYGAVTKGLDRALISLALRESGGNQVTAARELGISRNTLRDRLGIGKEGKEG